MHAGIGLGVGAGLGVGDLAGGGGVGVNRETATKMKKGCIILLIFMLAATLAGVYWIFFVPRGIAIDKTRYPITGIDVSAHTGLVDFVGAKKQKIDFAYIKATEGANYVDPKFEKNYRNAKTASIPPGAYHFFRFNKSGTEQAENFLTAIRGKKFHLPLVLDVEEWGNSRSNGKKKVVAEIRVFLNLVQNATGRRVMIYTNESSYKKYIRDYFKNNDIWLCSFRKNPNIGKKWVFWQHSHRGKFDFAEGWVDVNTFHGGRAAWERYWRR